MKRSRQDAASPADSSFALFAESGLADPTASKNAELADATSAETSALPDVKAPRKKRAKPAKTETTAAPAPSFLFGGIEPIEPAPVADAEPEAPPQVDLPENAASESTESNAENATVVDATAIDRRNDGVVQADKTVPESPDAPSKSAPQPESAPESRPAPSLKSVPTPAAPSAYQVVARRYRPQTFGELIGQGTVARALSNAIETNRVGHAYLFTGARGVGKTSCARIFAKALNCVDGPTTRPCLKCDSCVAVATGDDVDVIEIDGASNRGVDEIRQLRQNATIAPSRSSYKIYIIDEVHMLTREAFNALLKTLEEPPTRVKFIFCTTEPNKIPITILSRCQRFDFLGVDSNSIAERLAQIAAQEGAEAEPGVFEILARRANGSMRDAQSLLEQLLSFAPTFISEADARGMLGSVDDQKIFDLLAATLDGDAARTFEILGAAGAQGVDFGVLVEQTLGVFRDLMVVGSGCGPSELIYSPVARIDELRRIADALGIRRILASLQILDQTAQRMRFSAQSRILAELAFARLCRLDAFQAIESLIEQIRGGTFPPPTATTPDSLESDVKKKNNAAALSAPRPTFVAPSKPAEVPSKREAPRPEPTSNAPRPAVDSAPPVPASPASPSASSEEPPYFAVDPDRFETEISLPDDILPRPTRRLARPTAPSVSASERPVEPTAPFDVETAKTDASSDAGWLRLPPNELAAIWIDATRSLGRILPGCAGTFCGVRAEAPNAFDVFFPGDRQMQRDYCNREKGKIEASLATRLGGPVAARFLFDETKKAGDSFGGDFSSAARDFGGPGPENRSFGGSFSGNDRQNAAPRRAARGDLFRRLDQNEVVRQIKDIFEAELIEVRPPENRR